MICRILLLIILTSHVCATFVVNVTQSSYQTEENHNITLEWTFTPKPGTSSRLPDIYCELRTYLRPLMLFHVVNGVEMTFYHDEQFSGRVQSDRDALREGRLRLHMSRLRTEDSGQYWCRLDTESGWGSASCEVLVSAAADLPPQTPTMIPEQEPQETTRSYAAAEVGVAVAAAALLIICVTVLVKQRRKKTCCFVSENPRGVVHKFLMNHNVRIFGELLEFVPGLRGKNLHNTENMQTPTKNLLGVEPGTSLL
ncbi:uncharacterized protein LOC133420870 isoform X2 [Cololabis saira]|uniref:uncharacterized protein LOC133420870 isoform X2 n=1 Tax=Cololabis saira TaxID=129043 RepID=UPI002AD35400|nr:uncharacterized protein LOC133420870 isoform X2 [Cololabis saira]